MDGSGRINACSNNFRRKNSAGYRTVLFGISQVRHMGSTIMIDAVEQKAYVARVDSARAVAW
jgi:hypothetical protein